MLQKILEDLIELNRKTRSHYDETLNGLSPRQYVEEFCIIKVDPGRQTGKTIAVMALAREGEVIIVPHRVHTHHHRGADCPVMTAEIALEYMKVRGTFSNIWFDELTGGNRSACRELRAVGLTDLSAGFIVEMGK